MVIHGRLANTRLLALFGVFALLVVGILWWSFSLVPKTTTTSQPKKYPCPTDAKVCPDGSYISRTGANCTFAECLSTRGNTNGSGIGNTNTEVIPTIGNGVRCEIYTTEQGKIRYCSTCGDGRCDRIERCVPLNTYRDFIVNSCGPLYCDRDCQTNTNISL